MTEGFSVISNLAVTTRIAVNYPRADFFLNLKIIFNLQNGKFLSIVRPSLVLKSSEALPKYGKTQINSLLGTMKLRPLWINSLFKNFLIQ